MFTRVIGIAILLALVANGWLLYEQNRKLELASAGQGATPVEPTTVRESAQVVAASTTAVPVDFDGYRRAAVVAQVLNYLSGLKIQVDERVAMQGEPPEYLSDMKVLYPEANSPEAIAQVRMLSDGSLGALLDPGEGNWVVLRRQSLESYPYTRWQCQVNFELPHGPSMCRQANIAATPVVAGFDCARASSELEQFICRRDRLMNADYQLNESWRRLQERNPLGVTVDEQREWMNSRASRCPRYSEERADCLDALMRARIDQFERLAEY